MKRKGRVLSAAALVVIAAEVSAEPMGLLDQDGGYLDFISANITTGASVFPRTGSFKYVGTDIGATDTLFNYHEYTTQQVQLGNDDEFSQSVVDSYSLIGKIHSESYADGAGNLEVGADGVGGASRAWSHFSLSVKNYRSRPVNLQFAFDIPAGEVVTHDPSRYPATDPRRSHATVRAGVGAYLKSPNEEEPGIWDETEHSLFDFYVDMFGSCAFGDPLCAGVVVDYSDNARPYIKTRDRDSGSSIYGIEISPYSGLLSLPEIPPYGELTVFYNMYALGSGHAEGAARGMLGDPLSISSGDGIRLFEIYPESPGDPVGIPEPTSILLLGAGLFALGFQVRRRGS